MKITNAIQKKLYNKWYGQYIAAIESAPSLSVVKFEKYLRKGDSVLVVCSGNGRNVNYLTNKGFNVTGIDFSGEAIEYAQKTFAGKFVCQDISKSISIRADFIIDCNGTIQVIGRAKAIRNIVKALKPRGHLMVYAVSDKDQYQRGIQHDGIYGGSYSIDELKETYSDLRLIEIEEITETIKDKEYQFIYAVFQKPAKAANYTKRLLMP